MSGRMPPKMSPAMQGLMNQRNQQDLARQKLRQGSRPGEEALSVRPRGVGGPPPQGIDRPSGLTQSQANQVLQGLLGDRPRGAGGPFPQVEVNPNVRPMPSPNPRQMQQGPLTQSGMQPQMPSSGGFMSGLSQLMGSKAPIPQPGQVGSATGAMPNIGGFPTPPMGGGMGTSPKPGAMLRKGGPVKAKAPVKKAMGGKVAAKPVTKKAGGKVAAKPTAKPVMKKAGGRVAAKPKMKRK